jgi:hypothetical protein
MGKEYKLQGFENKVPRKICEPKEDEISSNLGYYMMWNSVMYTGYFALLGE